MRLWRGSLRIVSKIRSSRVVDFTYFKRVVTSIKIFGFGRESI